MVSDSFWTDTYVSNLDPVEKLLFLYLLTNPLCNIAGIYEIQVRRIAFDTGIEEQMVEKLLKRFQKDGKLMRCDTWILLVNHAKHQSYKNPNVTKGISRIIEELPEKVKALKGFERLSHFTLLNLTLPNGEKNMDWNKKSDDYEEGVIDLDGDGEIKNVAAPRTKKYPNAPAIRKIFLRVLGINPNYWKQQTPQLQACENLYTERTPEKVEKALEFYKEHQNDEFCPKINSPYDLDAKWTKLGEYKLKKET